MRINARVADTREASSTAKTPARTSEGALMTCVYCALSALQRHRCDHMAGSTSLHAVPPHLVNLALLHLVLQRMKCNLTHDPLGV